MSRLFDISLAITYLYESPAVASRNLLRILPRNTSHQMLISGLVSADPVPDFRSDSVDFFGNPMTEIAYDAPVREIVLRFNGRVRRTATPPALDMSPSLAALGGDVQAAASLDPMSPQHFIGPSERIPLDRVITAYMRERVRNEGSTLAAVQTIAAELHAAMTFDAEATDVSTRPIEAFNARRGVCQDFSHIMISALRGLGIPAGYVSGFLRTVPPEGQARLVGADAMHAWVSAWCGAEMGWVQIDPTNNTLVGTDHIVVALGRDYFDVAPVRGAIRAAGGHASRHEVDVVAVDSDFGF